MNPLIIVAIIVVLVLMFYLLSYILADPYTLQQMQNGQTASTIEASSLASSATSAETVNFAYSIWFYINDWNYRYGEPKVIFGRLGGPSAATTTTNATTTNATTTNATTTTTDMILRRNNNPFTADIILQLFKNTNNNG